MEQNNISQNKETITRREVLQVLIPAAAVVFCLAAIIFGKVFLVPHLNKVISYRKIVNMSVKEGDILTLGKYDWNNTWRVLKVEENCILVINDECIDVMNMDGNVSPYDVHLGKCCKFYPYIPDNAEIHHAERWKNTGLKRWLNETYYEVTFNSKEKELISDTEYGKMFILSADEAREYFKSNSDRRAVYIKGDVSWWLRSSSSYESEIYNDYVNYDGNIDGNSICYSGSNIGVRPAMWLEVSGK